MCIQVSPNVSNCFHLYPSVSTVKMRKRRCAKRFEIDGPHKVEIQKAILVRIRLVNPPEVERLKQVKRVSKGDPQVE